MIHENRYDELTEKWFKEHPDTETTVMRCDDCGLFYKPSLGHKCKMAKYSDLDIDFKNKEVAKNYDKIIETKNVFAGLEYLLARAHTIRETTIILMIVEELKRRDIREVL